MNSRLHTDPAEKVAEVVARFHREQQGQAPRETRAEVLPDMAVVVTDGVFTAIEVTLSQSEEGRKLIQSARREQRALTRRAVEAEVGRVLGRRVLRSYYDLDVRIAEQVEVYMLGEHA